MKLFYFLKFPRPLEWNFMLCMCIHRKYVNIDYMSNLFMFPVMLDAWIMLNILKYFSRYGVI